MIVAALDFRKLPKAELHCHLDGSLRPETMLDIARREHVPLPAEDVVGLKKALRCGEVRSSLGEYLEAFALSVGVLQSEAAIERVAYELVVDAAADGVWRLEARFCPLLCTARGLAGDAVVAAALRGMTRSARETGISTGLILCGMRDRPPDESLAVARLAVAFKDQGVVGFDLAGAERGFAASRHAGAVRLAREGGLGITIHAGEADGPSSIADALALGAARIGHGTRLGEDPALLAEVRAAGAALEVCLTSNLETGVVPALAAHPFAAYLRAGLRVTLNTDNRLMSDVSLSEEYRRAAEAEVEAGVLSREEIAAIVKNGFLAAFMPSAEKLALLARVEARLFAMSS